MKLLFAIVSSEDTNALVNALLKAKLSVTKLSTTGGFLKVGNTTLLIGVNDDKVGDVFKIIENNCKSRKEIVPIVGAGDMGMFSAQSMEVSVGGATVFIVNVDSFKKM
jgi:uncharacterized protein YaaQ